MFGKRVNVFVLSALAAAMMFDEVSVRADITPAATVRKHERTPTFRRVELGAILPEGGWAHGFVGDYDGDGTSDYLAVSAPPSRIWIAWGDAAIGSSERYVPATSLFSIGQNLTEGKLVAGDFFGTGKSGILIGDRERENGDLIRIAFDRKANAFTAKPVARPETEFNPVVLLPFRQAGIPTAILLQNEGQGTHFEILRIVDNRLLRVDKVELPFGFFVIAVGSGFGDDTDEVFMSSGGVNIFDFKSRKAKFWIGPDVWQTLPHDVRRRSTYFEFGDFNGDGLLDFNIHWRGVLGWHFFAGSDVGGISVPTKAPYRDSYLNYDIIVGDMNGDGYDDFMRRGWHTKEKFDIILSIPGAPLEGVELTLDGATVGRCGADGVCNLDQGFASKSTSDMARIEARKPGYLSSRGERSRLLDNSATINFLGVSTVGEDGSVGRAVEAGNGFTSRLPGPFVCTGFNYWSEFQWDLIEDGDCPEGYAVFGASELATRSDDPRDREIHPRCCGLPLSDILLPETSQQEKRCPEGSVVVGVRNEWYDRSRERKFVCRAINRSRYSLEQPKVGGYFGEDTSARRHLLLRRFNQLPIALRGGPSRESEYRFLPSVCSGSPPGSLFVGGRGITCHDYFFSRLVSIDDRKPVEMFPHCRHVLNPFSPLSGCHLAIPQASAVNADVQ